MDKGRMEWEELEEQIRVLKERLRRADESQLFKDKVIHELNVELTRLKGETLENSQYLPWAVRRAQMVLEVERLKSEKSAACRALEELNLKLSKGDKNLEQVRVVELEREVEILKGEKIAADDALYEMKQKLFKANQDVELQMNFKIEREKIKMERGLVEEKRRLEEIRSREEVERLKAEKLAVTQELDEMRQKLSKADETREQLRSIKIDYEKFMRELDLVEEECRLEELRNREEIERLEDELLAANEDLDEMKQKLSKADQTVEQLRNFEFECEKLTRERVWVEEKYRLVELRSGEEVEKLKDDKKAMNQELDEMKRKLSEADETVEQLRNVKTECEKLTRECVLVEEKCRLLELRSIEEVEKLKGEKLVVNQELEETKRKLSEADRTVEQLRNLNSERAETVKELRHCLLRSSGSDAEMGGRLSVKRLLRCDEIIKDMRLRQTETEKTDITGYMPELHDVQIQWLHLDSSRPSQPQSTEAMGDAGAASVTIEELKRKLSTADQTIQELRCLNSEASETIKGLENRLLKSNATIEDMKLRLAEADKNMEDLRSQSSEVFSTIAELRQKQSTADQTIQDLRLLNLEASYTIDQLNQHLLRSDETIKEMRMREAEADKIMEDLRHQKLEAFQTLEKLKSRKLKADKVSESNKKRLEMLLPINMKIEEGLASLLKFDMDDLVNMPDVQENSCALELDKDFLYSGDRILGAADRDVDPLKREDGANDVDTGTSSEADSSEDESMSDDESCSSSGIQ